MRDKIKDLVPVIRREVLELRATKKVPYGFGLDLLSKNRNRGHVMAALVILAHEGIVYTRRKPETIWFKSAGQGGDKIYHIRISPADAESRLAKMT